MLFPQDFRAIFKGERGDIFKIICNKLFKKNVHPNLKFISHHAVSSYLKTICLVVVIKWHIFVPGMCPPSADR